MDALEQVRTTLERDGLVAAGDSVLVALSGGPDSVALLHILSRLRRRYRLRLGAIYVNHQIRKRAALREEQYCRELCDRLKVEFHLVREDIPGLAKKYRKGIEEVAREFRYTLFERLAVENGYDHVAVGHHADDQVETIIFRLFRGTGPEGLRGMPIKRGRIIRPLLRLTRLEIMNHLKRFRIKWCEDVSNRSLRFKRNYIRHKLLPAVRTELNPSVERAILNLADTLGDEDAFVEAAVDRIARKCLTTSTGGKFSLALDCFRTYAVGLRRRLLRRCLKATWRTELAPDKQVVARLDLLAAQDSGALALPGKVRAVIVGGRLYLYRTDIPAVRESLEIGRRLALERPQISLSARIRNRESVRLIKRARAQRVLMDWDQVNPPLVVRSVRPGDRFRPLGMNGAKKIGDYLTDRKVPRPLRDEILLLCDRQGPIWLLGLEIAERVKVSAATRKVLSVGYTIRKSSRSETV